MRPATASRWNVSRCDPHGNPHRRAPALRPRGQVAGRLLHRDVHGRRCRPRPDAEGTGRSDHACRRRGLRGTRYNPGTWSCSTRAGTSTTGQTPEYLFEFPYLTGEAAKYLVSLDPKAVGTEGASVGGWADEAPAHGPRQTSTRRIHTCRSSRTISSRSKNCATSTPSSTAPTAAGRRSSSHR